MYRHRAAVVRRRRSAHYKSKFDEAARAAAAARRRRRRRAAAWRPGGERARRRRASGIAALANSAVSRQRADALAQRVLAGCACAKARAQRHAGGLATRNRLLVQEVRELREQLADRGGQRVADAYRTRDAASTRSMHATHGCRSSRDVQRAGPSARAD